MLGVVCFSKYDQHARAMKLWTVDIISRHVLMVLQKAERLRATLHLTGQAQPHQKTVFEDEAHKRAGQAAAALDDVASDSDDASDLRENVREASATTAVDDNTAARVSRFAPRLSGLQWVHSFQNTQQRPMHVLYSLVFREEVFCDGNLGTTKLLM